MLRIITPALFVRLLMRAIGCAIVTLASLVVPSPAGAAGPNFSGTWTIDLRTPFERKSKAECGNAFFTLKQTADRITGDHTMSTAGCGRLNEGGEGSVKGVVIGSTAVLVITSGRNGAIAMGTAILRNGSLHWAMLEEVKPGEPEGDSPLILNHGVLSRTPEVDSSTK